jgi:hypothetical protein
MKNIFNVRTIIAVGLFVVPLAAIAQGGATDISGGFTTLGGLVETFTSSVVRAVAILFLTLAVVAFFWGIVEYIWGKRKGDPKAVNTGGMFMVWGLVALFVMFSVWGIVRYAQRIFGIEGNTTIQIPDVQFSTSGAVPATTPGLPATPSLRANNADCTASAQCQSGFCSPNDGVSPANGGKCAPNNSPGL